MPSVVLIFPPIAKPCEPPAGIARLHGALSDAGISCTCIDANLNGQLDLLQRPVNALNKRAQQSAHNVQANLQAIRNLATFSQIDPYRRIVGELDYLLQQHGRPFHARLGLANYTQTGRSLACTSDLYWAAKNPDQNPFFDYYREKLIPQISLAKPELIGISISFLNQAFCAFSLIGLLRKEFPQIPIVLGGGLINSWVCITGKTNLFSDLVQGCAAGPGESFLLQRFGYTCGENLSPTFEYSDLFSPHYLAPGFILPFAFTYGCYWHRCRFCPECAENNPFLALEPVQAVQQLKYWVDRFKPNLIHFLDNAMPIEFIAELIRTPPGVPWYGYMRLERELCDADFCRQLARAGCAMLKIGLESGSHAVLCAMNKGIRLDWASGVLHNLQDAGIGVFAYVLFGTPAESVADARKTLAFLQRHHEQVDFLNAALFNLPLNSPDTAALQTHPFSEANLSLYCKFHHPLGWDRRAVRQFLAGEFRADADIRKILRRDPTIFTANHAPFFLFARTTGAEDGVDQS
ncbi:radical SAM protein [candidate division KSB1 bacterium]|nr:radical SAM protein [candidate division KSB1 bacterium]